MPAPNEITVPQLLRLIGTPDCPALVDICIEPDHAEDPFLIPGSFRHRHTDVEGLKERLKGRHSVIICQKGIKLSQGLDDSTRCPGLFSTNQLSLGLSVFIPVPSAPNFLLDCSCLLNGWRVFQLSK